MGAKGLTLMSSAPAMGKQQAKSIRAREAICEATIDSLVNMGYAETSLNRVAAAAGFSKGALQYHFPSKEDLIAATLNRLLERPFKRPQHAPSNIEDALMFAWTRYIDTPAYRALLEILNAARTDELLQVRVADDLLSWGLALDLHSVEQFESISGDNDEVVMLLNMTRSFMRGLLVQENYGNDRAQSLKYIKKWITLISPLLQLRDEPEN